MNQYDVFISCKSEDYKYAEEIYDFLKENGFNVFLASKELRNLGESEYRRSISKALRSATHIIVFSSNPDYIESEWVYYEWDMFVTAKLKKFKSGNIVTILKGVKVEEINMDLWKYESFQFDSYKNSLLNYVETDQHKERLANQSKEAEAERLRKEKERAEQERRKKLKAELVTVAEHFKKDETNLTVDISKIRSILKQLNIQKRKCPICEAENSISDNYCHKCGWDFSPLDGIEWLSYLNGKDSNRETLWKSIYTSRNSTDTFNERIEKLKAENTQLLEDQKSLLRQIQELNGIKGKLSKELTSSKAIIQNLHRDNEVQTEEISKLIHQVSQSNNLIQDLKNRLGLLQRNSDNSFDKYHKRPSSTTSSTTTASSTTALPSGYSVLVSFCPAAAMSIVKELLPSFTNTSVSNFKDNPIKVATYQTRPYAENLKNRLESKGATVHIKYVGTNSKPMEQNSQHTDRNDRNDRKSWWPFS